MSHRRAIIMSLQTAMRLIERRARKQPKAEHVTYAYSKDEDQERSSYIRIEPIILTYDEDLLSSIGECFQIHPLLLADIEI